MKTFLLMFTLISVTLLFACQKDQIPIDTANIDCATVSYASVIKPLFDRTCGGSDCHGRGGAEGEITNYRQTKRYVDNGTMKK